MDDHEILQHLLALESEAEDLVNEAQATADRRVSEGEKQNRVHYDEVYAREVEVLEASYIKDLAVVKENCQKQLDAYKESLGARQVDTESFSSLVKKYLSAREP